MMIEVEQHHTLRKILNLLMINYVQVRECINAKQAFPHPNSLLNSMCMPLTLHMHQI